MNYKGKVGINMNVSREMKKKEAIERMKSLSIINDAISQFKKDNIVMVSEPPFGALYWLNEEEKQMVKEFEDEYNVLVYMVVRAFTNFGKMDSLLFVSDYDYEWDYERYNAEDGYIMSYTINHDAPECSDMGSIVVKPMFGGLLRRY